jgi:two-component system chemotaxis response regulator CheB
MIRVVVAEDSRTVRELLVSILESSPDLRVVGQASNGAEAVALAERLRPDLVTMDIHMPVMDGFEATRQIMARVPTPILIVSSAASPGDVELSLQATRLGALMVLPKPGAPGSPRFEREARELVSMARAMAGVKVVRQRPAPSARVPASLPPEPRFPVPHPRVVAMVSSTGGPAALQQVLGELPAAFPWPVLVVQHIAHGFTGALAHWLDGGCPLRVKVAEAGERLLPGVVYVAPDDRHLGAHPDATALLSAAEAVRGFRPSGTFLFDSVARSFGAAAVGVILTGMGNDGVEGLRRLHAAGAQVIAQDEASSVVYGMPREAVLAGVATEVLALDRIGPRLAGMARAAEA